MGDETQRPRRPAPADLETSFSGRTVRVGDIVVGRIVKITGNVAFMDYGARSEGYIELGEFRGPDGAVTIAEGDEVEAEVVETRGAVRLSTKKAEAARVLKDLQAAWKAEEPVEGKVVAVNKGGFEIRVNGVRAFCPSSQFADRFAREPASEVGNTYPFLITEFSEGKGLVVSRRALLEREKADKVGQIGLLVREGDIRQGRVTQLKEFGAFVDLGDGIEGLVHLSEISHGRIGHPREKLNVGDAVDVKVIKVEAERGRVGLSIRALEDDPWSSFVATLTPGQALTGTVERLQPFGAFIALAPGVDGLLHISAISDARIGHPSEVLEVGQEVAVLVEKVDHERKRVSLLTPAAAESRKGPEITVAEGDVVKGTVSRVEKYGVFLEIAPKVVGLIPNAEMDTDRGADHARMFPVGTELEVKVIEIDRSSGRIRLSRKALKGDDDASALREYKQRQKAEAPKSLGTFGDLLKDFLKK
ncbi:MAG: S1 RNA-binding domain-containing protein [Myxococcales bacterium]|nr:S1 RNA-binding domain-containing protein [Myxococcales bacterium]MCB9546398.1 S1 RNA-binding domain-containing protein [Myxococcales bacterium]